MKKVLFVLGLAMCGTLAMAQTNKVANKLCDAEPAIATKTMASASSVDYKASIFTKDDDDVLATFNFADMTNVTIGQVHQGEMLDGAAVAANDAHGRTEPSFNWRRVNDTATVLTTAFAAEYSDFTVYNSVYTLAAYMGVQNGIEADNGFMFLDLCEDDVPAMYTTKINTYFKLAPVAVSSDVLLVDVTWRQYYRKYYDKCYVDYSADGTNWTSFEVNVSGVDINVGGIGSGYMSITLPQTALSPNMHLRFRLVAGLRNVPYGYAWAVDDVKVVAVTNPNRWSFNSEGLLNGFYGILPEGFQVPISYCVFSRNTSVNNLTGNQLTINHAFNDQWSPVFSVDQDAMAAGDPTHDYLMEINESGFMYSGGGFGDYRGYHAFVYFYDQYGASDAEVAAMGFQRRALPTTGVGTHEFNIVASNTNGLIDTLDGYHYVVSDNVEANSAVGRTVPGYRWANDNGVVPGYREFGYGFTSGARPGYVTDNCGHQYETDYEVLTRYNTPSVIPTDANGNPWVIRGIEYVTSTKLSSLDVDGASIVPLIYYFRQTSDSTMGLYNWMGNTGLVGDPELITASSAPATPEDLGEYSLFENENYYCYNVLFPDQPEIQPNMSFLVGYTNNGGGDFAVATTSTSTGVTADSSVAYRSIPELADYARQYTPTDKVYDVYCYDPIQGSANDTSVHTVSGWNITRYPMIRLIVGPKMEIPRYEQYLDCGDEDQYWIYYDGDEACGVRDSANENSGRVYYFIPGQAGEMDMMDETNTYYVIDTNSDYVPFNEIDHIYIDNQPIDLNNTDMVEKIPYDFYWLGHTPADSDPWEPAMQRYYYAVTVRNINAEHTYSADCRPLGLSIRNIEDNVSMQLAPNPATSQVSIKVAGFNGKANCSILDMSGRVVYSTDITAGESVISLNGVPAGAYFVRVTNDTFSKVEKLIVR